MVSKKSQAVAENAQNIYRSKWQAQLEQTDSGRYVSIEPVSGQYFLGNTFDQAVNAAIDAFPDRLTHTLLIGRPAAFHLGVVVA